MAQLVERRTGIREVTGSSPVEVLNFFQASLRIYFTTARIILHLISYPQFTYDLFHMHHSFVSSVTVTTTPHHDSIFFSSSLFFSGSQKVDDLPGVGWSLGQRLETLGVKTCSDLQKLSLQALQKEFGQKTGLQLYQYCRGIDDRTLRTERERKSVSAEINYGIRFTKVSQQLDSNLVTITNNNKEDKTNNTKEAKSWPKTMTITTTAF